MNRLDLRNKEFKTVKETMIDFLGKTKKIIEQGTNTKELFLKKDKLLEMKKNILNLTKLKYAKLERSNSSCDLEINKDERIGVVKVAVGYELERELIKRTKIKTTEGLNEEEILDCKKEFYEKIETTKELEIVMEVIDELLNQIEEILVYWTEDTENPNLKKIKETLKAENEIVYIIETDLEGNYEDDIIVERNSNGNLIFTPIYKYETYNELPEEEKNILFKIINVESTYYKEFFKIEESYAKYLIKNGLDGIGEIKVPVVKISEDGSFTISGSKKIRFNGAKIKADNENYHNRFMNVDKKNLVVSEEEIEDYIETMCNYNIEDAEIENNINSFIYEDAVKAVLRNVKRFKKNGMKI